jgi:hypothetical protein
MLSPSPAKTHSRAKIGEEARGGLANVGRAAGYDGDLTGQPFSRFHE